MKRKRKQRCVFCFNLRTKRIGKVHRKLRKPLQRFLCIYCKKSFTLAALSRSRLTYSQKIKITKTHLEGRTSIRQIVRDTGYAKQTIQNSIQEVIANCVNSVFIAKRFIPQWGDNLAVDGLTIRVYDWSAKHFRYSGKERKFLHKLIWLCALDLKTLDIVHHHLGDEETMIDLLIFYRQLKGLGYNLKGLVSDGNTDILRSARMIFGDNFKYQACIRHYQKNLLIKMKQGLITEKKYREYYEAIISKNRIIGLPQELFTYLNYPGLPRTNQQIENLFRQVRLRTKSIGQFRSYHTAYGYLNAWSLFRRFTPFTDCRNKDRNGKAPLTLAGCDISDIDYLKLDTLN